MLHDEKKALSNLRIENAKTLLNTARQIAEFGDYKSAANRSYYAIFNAMRAELAMLGIDRKKHSAVISEFRLNFIKTEVYDIKYSKMIAEIFEVRSKSDYDDFFIVSKQEVEAQISNAKEFIDEVERRLADL